MEEGVGLQIGEISRGVRFSARLNPYSCALIKLPFLSLSGSAVAQW